jgi:protein-tyrosine phosphatase
MENRLFKFDGIVNFRDFGGYATQDGRTVRAGRLYRSAHFADASDADMARLEALNVKRVFDFRQATERTISPSKWPSGARVQFRVDEEGAVAPPAGAPAQFQFTADASRRVMQWSYRRFATETSFVNLYRALFDALADEGGPIVVHCTAGKDRTGIACALVLHSLGVDRDTIVSDYILTNASVDPARRRALVRLHMEQELNRQVSDEEIEPLIGVEAGYLAAALEAIEEKGGLDSFLSDTLGVTPQKRERLRAHLLE